MEFPAVPGKLPRPGFLAACRRVLARGGGRAAYLAGVQGCSEGGAGRSGALPGGEGDPRARLSVLLTEEEVGVSDPN